MKWEETVASQCRYGDVAERIFGDCDIIWENSENGYQGFANVLAAKPDGSFIHYEWTYGSCIGCDEWESRALGDDEIEQEMRAAMATLRDVATLKRYLKLEKEYEEATIPTANSSQNGSIAEMLRTLLGGSGTDFVQMGEVALQWLQEKGL